MSKTLNVIYRHPKLALSALGVAIVTAAFLAPAASRSHAATTLPGDINGDQKVDIFDLSILLSNFGKTAAQTPSPTATATPTKTPVSTTTPVGTPQPATKIQGDVAQIEPGLLSKAGVFYFGGFEGTPSFTTAMKSTAVSRAQNSAVITGPEAFQNKTFRVFYAKGTQSTSTPDKGGSNFNINFDSSGINVGAKDKVYLRYYVRFQPGFQFVMGGKLPGMAGGTNNSGGNKPTGYDGWSGRLMWRTGGAIQNYMYLPTDTGVYGEEMNWTYGGTARKFTPGKWQCVEMQYTMNTPGQSNGIARSWLDGDLALSRTNVRYRETTKLAIDNFTFSTFFGGSGPQWASTQDQYIYYDNIVMSSQPIGCAK